jgi:hypothetical protein
MRRQPHLEWSRATSSRLLDAVREAALGRDFRYGRTAEFGRNDGAGRPSADNITLAGEHRVSGINRPAGGREFFGEAALGREAIAGPKLTDPDRGPEVLVNLTIERDVVAECDSNAAFPGDASHGLAILPALGPIG